MSNVRLTIVGKPDCHLCDVASEVVDEVVGGVISEIDSSVSVEVERVSILDAADLYEKYWEQIPVILINGVEHAHWHVDRERLRAAILAV